jgi:hypothetical protein
MILVVSDRSFTIDGEIFQKKDCIVSFNKANETFVITDTKTKIKNTYFFSDFVGLGTWSDFTTDAIENSWFSEDAADVYVKKNLLPDDAATETQQILQTAALGAPADAAASSDAGTFSITALLKRALTHLTSIFTRQSDRSQKTQITNGSVDATFTGTSINVSNTEAIIYPKSSMDATGRLKVSIPAPQVSLKYRYGKLPLLVDEIINGTATSIHSTTNSCIALTVATAGDYVIRQTHKRGNYISGIGQVVEFTTSDFHVETGKTKRRGYYSSSPIAPQDTVYDGLSLYNDNLTINLNVHRSGTLTASATQADWDDPLDGTGASGVVVDNAGWELGQICAFDFIWLGYGRVAFWMNFNGAFHLIHTFYFANSIKYPYMSSPNQPLRTELRSTSGAGTLNEVCASIYADDGFAESKTGFDFALRSGATAVTATTAGTMYAMLGVRLKSTNIDSITLLKSFTMNNSSNTFGTIVLIENPTVAGTFTYNNVSDRPVSFAIGTTANTVTGGIEVGAWSIDRNVSATLSTKVTESLGTLINGTTLPYVLCIVPSSNNLTWTATMNLTEVV